VEVLKDLATRVAPLREEDARAMLDELKGQTMLEGARGQKPPDLEALIDIIMKVSRLVVDLEDYVEELDINPLVAYEKGKGAMAADALLAGARSR